MKSDPIEILFAYAIEGRDYRGLTPAMVAEIETARTAARAAITGAELVHCVATARTAALEEAASICANYGREGDRSSREHAADTADELAARIRALVTI